MQTIFAVTKANTCHWSSNTSGSGLTWQTWKHNKVKDRSTTSQIA